MDKLLACPVCLERFQEPKQLPCGHTCCVKCLRGLMENYRLRCPECRENHEVPRIGVEGFPPNWTLKRLLDNTKSEISCQGCSKVHCMVGKCEHCPLILCRDCLVKHTSILSDELGLAISKAQKRMSQVSDNISQVKRQQQKIRSNETAIVKAIDLWVDRCISEIHKKKQDMVNEVKRFANGEIRPLQSKQESEEFELAKIESFIGAAGETRVPNNGKLSHRQKLLRSMIDQGKEYFIEKNAECIVEKEVKFQLEEANVILKETANLRCISFVTVGLQQGVPLKATAPVDESASATRIGTVDQQSVPTASLPQTNRAILQEYQKIGRVKRYFGRRGVNEGCMKIPWGVAATQNGNTIVTEYGNDRLQIFDSLGNSIEMIGELGTGEGEFDKPLGVCMTTSGHFAVADAINNRIQIFDPTGRFVRTFKGRGKGKLSSPWSVAASNERRLYVVDESNSIKVFSLDGMYISCFGHTWLNSKGGEKYITLTPRNKIVVTETKNHRLGVFDENGLTLWERGHGQFKHPRGVACDHQGNIIVADCGNNQIKIFDVNVDYVTGFGGRGSDPDYFDSPNDVSVTKKGDIVVTDSNNNRIQIF